MKHKKESKPDEEEAEGELISENETSTPVKAEKRELASS